MTSFFDEDTNENLLTKYLLVDISEVIYAFKIESVKEIIPVIDMFSIESISKNLTGLINLRGKTIPVYDIRGFLGKELKPFSVNQKFLLLEGRETDFAIIIDNVGDIVNIADKDISNINYNQSLDFLKTTILDDKTIIITDANGFYNYAQTAQNVNKADKNELQLTEKTSLEKIKNRNALLNQNGQFVLQQDSLLQAIEEGIVKF
ncbi:MAG: chemotaxis protein CheW, partial [Candidatus Gastranaerophilales bacterium]|nr:chemotaxis protein CheW [Candidatus Gastranaerophilales bacterium]